MGSGLGPRLPEQERRWSQDVPGSQGRQSPKPQPAPPSREAALVPSPSAIPTPSFPGLKPRELPRQGRGGTDSCGTCRRDFPNPAPAAPGALWRAGLRADPTPGQQRSRSGSSGRSRSSSTRHAIPAGPASSVPSSRSRSSPCSSPRRR